MLECVLLSTNTSPNACPGCVVRVAAVVAGGRPVGPRPSQEPPPRCGPSRDAGVRTGPSSANERCRRLEPGGLQTPRVSRYRGQRCVLRCDARISPACRPNRAVRTTEPRSRRSHFDGHCCGRQRHHVRPGGDRWRTRRLRRCVVRHLGRIARRPGGTGRAGRHLLEPWLHSRQGVPGDRRSAPPRRPLQRVRHRIE